MRNNLSALNDYLFEAIERIQDDELCGDVLEDEIKRAEAVTEVAKVIIQNGELALKAMKQVNEYGGETFKVPSMLKE
ncbi:MAG: hypothetical protein IKU42_05975 [Oscillospiraceae bacterium]|nr:hypothetical protein [Oscillospiraceae bacterium]